MNKIWFAVANPISGGGRGGRDRDAVIAALRAAGVQFELAVSQHAGHTVQLAAQAARAGWRRFLAIGGDGTLSELVNGVLSSDACAPGEARFGLIPIGRGNDWARTHRVPKRYHDAAAIVALDHAIAHDVGVAHFDGSATPRYFVNAAGVGFDAHVVERTRDDRFGALSYLLALPRSLLTYRAPWLEISAAGQQITGKVFLAFASLNRYCGGGMLVAPQARCDDGVFDVTIVDEVSLAELLLNIKKLFDGTLPTYRKVRTLRAEALEILAPAPVNSEADGELIGATPLRFSTLPKQIQVVVRRS